MTEIQRTCCELLRLRHIVYKCFLPAVLEMVKGKVGHNTDAGGQELNN